MTEGGIGGIAGEMRGGGRGDMLSIGLSSLSFAWWLSLMPSSASLSLSCEGDVRRVERGDGEGGVSV